MSRYGFSRNPDWGFGFADEETANRVVALANDITNLVQDRGLSAGETMIALDLAHMAPVYGMPIKLTDEMPL